MLKEITLKMAEAMTTIEQSIVSNLAYIEQLDPLSLTYYDMTKPVAAQDEWSRIDFASVMDEEILGKISFSIKIRPRIVDAMGIISYVAFTETPVDASSRRRLEFVKDVFRSIDHMLMSRGYEKIVYSSVMDGKYSHERAYRALAEKAGKIIGSRRRDCTGRSGRVYDLEEYEIYRERWQAIRRKLKL